LKAFINKGEKAEAIEISNEIVAAIWFGYGYGKATLYGMEY
jgi:hypothetical protein